MSLTDFFKKFSIIIFVVLALILSRCGFGYLLILVLIGLIVSFINQRKREAIITGVLYALMGYILSYPTGLILNDYMPSASIPIEVSTSTVIMDLLLGALIPTLAAIIICGITAIIGSNIAKYMGERKSKDTSSVSTNYQHTFAHDDNQTDDYIVVEDKEELLNLTPIHKAKLRKERENNDEGE
jgi:lipopolysaccharide export LptBFGC system permease protein LptF